MKKLDEIALNTLKALAAEAHNQHMRIHKDVLKQYDSIILDQDAQIAAYEDLVQMLEMEKAATIAGYDALVRANANINYYPGLSKQIEKLAEKMNVAEGWMRERICQTCKGTGLVEAPAFMTALMVSCPTCGATGKISP